jgi:hypothetical protein
MKLRWLQRRKHITVDMVKEYSEKYSVGMMQAKRELESSNTGNQLQYCTWDGQWRDVDCVVEYFE